MKIEYNPDIQTLYLRLAAGTIDRTIELAPEIYLDLDSAGRVLGIEVTYLPALFEYLNQHEGRLDVPERIPA
ncbi:MAG TPA: DUF2283 domain-containing protein [Thermomicrobiaceae bacterium]|nr:DUF2283 domain-containing protein [Thermomicrobiaceae bacterium]